MRCATLSGGMGFEDLDAAERRRRARAKRSPERDIPSAPPAPPVHPKSRLVEREEGPGVPFEPAPIPEVISPPSKGKHREEMDEDIPEVIATEASAKYLPLPEELPPPESPEDLPDFDVPEEEREPRRRRHPEAKVEPERESPEEIVEESKIEPIEDEDYELTEDGELKKKDRAKKHHGIPAPVPKPGIPVSPRVEQLTGMPRVSTLRLGENGAGGFPVLAASLVLGGLAVLGAAIYFLKKKEA